eukprot:c6346_g1_i1.p1 GENE.c6346_g1_i1~~c6346_g1_i1.p1  ORF type:complete len:243 (-),score=45.05 c6346_g1_i1:28-756(-)
MGGVQSPSRKPTMQTLHILAQEKPKEEFSCWWKLFHVFNFALGGTTFIAGTACYLYPDWAEAFTVAAWLYTIGSVGFLLVDVQEIFTFCSDRWLTVNVFLSVCGSTLYIIGSVGFFPELDIPNVGIWGFILGSFFIGVSQIWKLHRIGSPVPALELSDGAAQKRFRFRHLFHDAESSTAVGVEAGACFGGWCFFFGTIMYQQGPIDDPAFFNAVIVVWMFGSVFFTIGSIFLGIRHFLMGVV